MNASEYRRQAWACLNIAVETQDRKSKAVLLDMADAWHRLADQVEHSHKYLAIAEQPTKNT